MRKNYLFGTSLPLRSLVGISFLLTAVACGACKKDDDKDKKDEKDEKTPLKFVLTAPAVKDKAGMQNSKNKPLVVGNLIIEVTEGKDDAANYKMDVVSSEPFAGTNYTVPDTDANKCAMFIYDARNLKEILGEDVLEKGNTKSIAIGFTSQAKKCTSRSGRVKISIVDKDGKVVGGPVEVKWTDA